MKPNGAAFLLEMLFFCVVSTQLVCGDWPQFTGEGDRTPQKKGLHLVDHLDDVPVLWELKRHITVGKVLYPGPLRRERAAGIVPFYGGANSPIVHDGVLYLSYYKPNGKVPAQREGRRTMDTPEKLDLRKPAGRPENRTLHIHVPGEMAGARSPLHITLTQRNGKLTHGGFRGARRLHSVDTSKAKWDGTHLNGTIGIDFDGYRRFDPFEVDAEVSTAGGMLKGTITKRVVGFKESVEVKGNVRMIPHQSAWMPPAAHVLELENACFRPDKWTQPLSEQGATAAGRYRFAVSLTGDKPAGSYNGTDGVKWSRATKLLELDSAGENTAPSTNPFFALCMDTHDSRKRDLAEQAAMLAELGYDGAGHLWLDHISGRLETLDAAGLKLFQVYLQVNIAPGKTPFDPRLEKVLPLLKGRKTMIALLVNGLPPSDPAGDGRAVPLIRKIADEAAKYGVKVALYHHVNHWLETVADMVRVAKKVNRSNVGIMFNLCHWMKDDGRDLKETIAAAKKFLFAVSINGSDTPEEIRSGKGNWIQPLDSGSYDLSPLVKLLDEAGFTGPVGLQCWGIGGDAREHLKRSIKEWRRCRAKVQKEQNDR